MALTKLGADKIAAKKLGMTPKEYLALVAQGLKHCRICRQWKQRAQFTNERSRYDGLCSKCRDCARTGKTGQPSRYERLLKKIAGLGWCKDCRQWHPLKERKTGRCRSCHAARVRYRHKTDEVFRHKRKTYAKLHRRGVEPVPPEGQDLMLIFDGLCSYCAKPAEVFDHVHPVVRGGRTLPNNILPACRSCNSRKYDKEVYDWLDESGTDLRPEVIERLCFMEHAMLVG